MLLALEITPLNALGALLSPIAIKLHPFESGLAPAFAKLLELTPAPPGKLSDCAVLALTQNPSPALIVEST